MAALLGIFRDLTSAFVNKIAERSHWRRSIWRPTATCISWKSFKIDEIKAVFADSSIPLAICKAFHGQQEEDDNQQTSLGGISAIVLAKARARGHVIRQFPTYRASLIIGEGDGRAWREFELIWWPDLFHHQERGKLTLHYYVGKVIIIIIIFSFSL